MTREAANEAIMVPGKSHLRLPQTEQALQHGMERPETELTLIV